ncbi:ABC transporter substrate-binding protein [Devosia sp. LjRoot3]|uniref:ABC transporter substrate-binding protein n=1 Tax=Devosia sp. LjRoot3 TaxID=3342319 RepID=UPI003ECC40EB
MTTRKTFLMAGTALLLSAILAPATFAQTSLSLDPNPTDRLHAEKNDAAAALLPADHKWAKDGVISIAVAPWAPPIATYATDATTVVGFDPDVARLVGEVLDVPVEIVPVAWADWPLGLASGKYDAVISNVGVTEERKEKFDFSTYRLGLHGFYVKADSPITAITEPKDIAGLKVITGSGTIQEKIILQWDELNKQAGLAPVEIQYYDDDAAAGLALASGRADTNFNPNSTQAYHAAQTGETKLVGTVSSGWPLPAEVGITTVKGSGLAEPFTAAINDLIETGLYAQLLEQWNLGAEGIDVAKTNPPGLPKP